MNEEKKSAIDALNEMFWSQGINFREQYRRNYFAILEYIVGPNKATLTSDEIHRALTKQERGDRLIEIIGSMKQ